MKQLLTLCNVSKAQSKSNSRNVKDPSILASIDNKYNRNLKNDLIESKIHYICNEILTYQQKLRTF